MSSDILNFVGTAFVKLSETELIPLMTVSEIEAETTPNEAILTGLRSPDSIEFIATLACSGPQKRLIGALLYGWRARGPIRRRALEKARLACYRAEIMLICKGGAEA